MNYFYKSKIGWLLKKENLIILYEKLSNAGRINCQYAEFESHFIGTATSKIEWYGSQAELIHIIVRLIEEKIIPPHNNYIILLSRHFIRQDGSPLNYKSLRALKSRLPNQFTEDFINDLLKNLRA